MNNPKSKTRIVIIILGIFSFLALLIILGIYLYIRGGKEENTKNSTEQEQSTGGVSQVTFFNEFSKTINSQYGYSLDIKISGTDAKLILPDWLYSYVEYALIEDWRDAEEILYIYGDVYGGGFNIGVSIANPQGYTNAVTNAEIDSEYVKSYETMHIVGSQEGIYITNPEYLHLSYIEGIRNDDFSTSMKDKYIKVGDGITGWAVFDKLAQLSEYFDERVESGWTERAKRAFTCNEDVSYDLWDNGDDLFTLPKGFSAFEDTKSDGNDIFIVEFTGSSENLYIEGYMKGIEYYISGPRIPKYKEIIGLDDFNRKIEDVREENQ